MGSILSRVCPCLGREVKEEKPKLSTDTYIQKQYEHNNLIHDELGSPVRFYIMNKRHYHSI